MIKKKTIKEVKETKLERKAYPDTETVLRMLAAGALLSTLFISPHLTMGVGILAKYLPWDKFLTSAKPQSSN